MRSVPVTWLLATHPWGSRCTSPQILIIPTCDRDAVNDPRVCVCSLHFSMCMLIRIRACSQAVQALKVVPWAADKPSFSAELARIVKYITRPEVRCHHQIPPWGTAQKYPFKTDCCNSVHLKRQIMTFQTYFQYLNLSLFNLNITASYVRYC